LISTVLLSYFGNLKAGNTSTWSPDLQLHNQA